MSNKLCKYKQKYWQSCKMSREYYGDFLVRKKSITPIGENNSLQPLPTCKHFFNYRLLKIISKERNKKFHYVHFTSIVTTNQMCKI